MQSLNSKFQNTGVARTKPFLLSGKAVDFISAMLSLIVLLSIIGEFLYAVLDKGGFLWGLLAIQGIMTIVLLSLICFYFYFGIRGLPVNKDKANSVKFPPARVKPTDLVIILSLLALDASVVGFVVNQFLNNVINTFSIIQLVVAASAFIIGVIALTILIKEHFIWKSACNQV